jgi:hypothetical protein
MTDDARRPGRPQPEWRQRYLRAAFWCLLAGLLVGGASYIVVTPDLAEGLGRVSILCTLTGITLTCAATERATDKQPPADRSGP